MYIARNPSRTYFIKTFGCTFNLGDSLKIESLLEKYHFTKVTNKKDAEILIINTCAVKHTTESKILYYISDLKKTFPKKRMLITGCLPQIGAKMKLKIKNILNPQDAVIKPGEIHLIPGILDPNLKSILINSKASIIPKPCLNQNVGIIQISEGCNNSCTYCCTTIARGSLQSFDPDDILTQFKELYLAGIREFLITSQDLGNYNYGGLKLHHLLERISKIQGSFQIRLGMLNPDYLISNLDDFLKIFKDHRYYRFLHIPIQSADNNVLKSMNRNYTIEDVSIIIKKIIEFDPKITFSTDIIVGFPSETKAQFEITMEYINHWRPLVLNISKYSVRMNTQAKKMKQLRSQDIKERSKQLHDLYQIYSKNKREEWLNWEGYVLITEKSNNLDFPFMARNPYYIPIEVRNGFIGQFKNLKIEKMDNYRLLGV